MLMYHQRKNIRQKIQQIFNLNYINVHRYNQVMGSHCMAITSIKTVGAKQIESHCKDITSIKLLTENEVFKCYVNKTILMSHFK